jgi:aminoglycoside phosphotransferase (APT) family kinase protein
LVRAALALARGLPRRDQPFYRARTMARLVERDMDEVGARLSTWVSGRIAGGKAVTVSDLSMPASTGYSGETFLFGAAWDGGSERLVARLKPSGHTVFNDTDFESEFRVIDALSKHTAVPMARTFGYENDESLFGVPFYVVEQVDGRIPSDNPPYAFGGWPADEPPKVQAAMWWSGLEAAAAVHRADWRALGLTALDRGRGRPGSERQLAWLEDYVAWITPTPPKLVADGLEWLRAHEPPPVDEPVLCWGDCRLANQIFRDGNCVAVLDWEMVTIGDPEMDLAWWIILDRVLSEGLNVARLPGFPDRDETAARYEELSGRPVKHLDFWQVWVAVTFAAVLMRLGQLMSDSEAAGFDTDSFAIQFVGRMLDEEGARA